MTTLPQFLRDLLASPPRHGEGVHLWLFRVARQLHPHYPDKGELAKLLSIAVAGCGRAVSRREIEGAITNSANCAWQPDFQKATISRASGWPKSNPEQIEAIIRDGGGLADLWEASAIRIEDNTAHTEKVIDHLFPGNPLLCCGASQSDFDTMSRGDWRGELTGLQFIVPSPMSAVTGFTKGGRTSKHTLSNTGPRRFLICEFDQGATDAHAALLLHLGRFAPLVCAVHSGGKSLHGWFFVAGQPDGKVEKFFRYAVSLGADRATWTRSQFVRMPDGTRDNGRRQTIYFLNFNPLETKP
ncbi:MAG: hypothetical protein WAO02_15570 [Verrucomicrobiia bacterium]